VRPGCAGLFEASLDYGGKPDPPDAKVFLVRCLEVLNGAAPAAESKYLDCQRAADYLGIKKSQLYDQVASGNLTPLRGPRNVYRFTTAMLDEYLHGK
jgi:excisionase family DNA binding protein